VLSEHDMKIAPQTYYRWLACPVRPTELEEAYLVNQIVDLYRRNRCVYGVRKMWHAARRDGLRLGRDQVGRLMRIAGIQGVRRGVHRTTTTTRDERAARHPDLVRRGWKTPNRPDAVWVADFTYVWTTCGFAYVSFITDVYSRRILGWRCSMSKTTDLVSAALAQALGHPAPGEQRVHRPRVDPPLRCGFAGWIQPVVATPVSGVNIAHRGALRWEFANRVFCGVAC
jgi:transposase InsO family protein